MPLAPTQVLNALVRIEDTKGLRRIVQTSVVLADSVVQCYYSMFRFHRVIAYMSGWLIPK